MNKLSIASNNADKIREIRDILLLNGIEMELLCPRDMDCHEEPEENGESFEENAYIKARFYHDLYHLPTIADDSGICIDFLDGGPGIHSARYLPDMNYDEKCDYIVNLLGDSTNRGAQFVDCIYLIMINLYFYLIFFA